MVNYDADTLDEFVQNYVTMLLWSTLIFQCDGECAEDECRCEPETAEALNYDADHLSPSAMASIREDCADFLDATATVIPWLATRYPHSGYAGRRGAEYGTVALMAYDFALTRNGHGAGFWDRGIGRAGEILTAIAKPYGGVDLYVGDDDLLYCE